jgi:antirestriction protein ArdC
MAMKQTREERQEHAETLRTELELFMEKVVQDKGELDKLAAHFRITGLYTYSLRNQCLIYFQGGTACNSYKRWQKMGRQVRKGERARIEILRPASRKVKEIDPKTGEENERWISSAHRFVTAKVFDVSQTDGEPIEFDHNSAEDSRATLDRIHAAADKLGFPVDLEMCGTSRGHTDGKRVVLNSASNETDQFKTALHEFAHCLLGHAGKYTIGRSTEEVEAEATAYLCLSALGIDYDLSAEYAASWVAHGTQVRTGKVISAATKIINALK